MLLPKTNPREPSIPTAEVLATGIFNQQFPTQFFVAESNVITSPLPPWFFVFFNYALLLEFLIN